MLMGIAAPLGLGTSRERAKTESQRFLLARAWWSGRAGLWGELGPGISRWVSCSSYEGHPFLLGFCFQWGHSAVSSGRSGWVVRAVVQPMLRGWEVTVPRTLSSPCNRPGV